MNPIIQNHEMNRIGVDLDSNNIKEFLFTYLNARKLFPEHKIETCLSSSGLGFHIKIHTSCSIIENFMYRAVLHDCPGRLMLSMKKYWMDGWTRTIDGRYDILFSEKNGKKTKKIDLESMIDKRKIKKILDAWGTEEGEKMLEQTNEKIEPEIKKLQGQSYATNIGFKGEELKEKIAKIVSDISQKDHSFRYRIMNCPTPTFDYILSIFSLDKDIAHKRGMLFTKKYLKEFSLYYWIKEMKR